MRKFVLFLAISAALLVPRAPAQTTVSYQKFGGYDGSPDVVDLGTLGLHLEIPLFAKQGRGVGTTIRFELVNSSGPQTCNTSPVGSGCLGYGPGISSGTSVSWWVRVVTSRTCLHDQALYTTTYSFQFTDEHGNYHAFAGTTTVTDCYNNINFNHYESSLSEQASDGSGYYLQATGWSGTVTDPSGSSYQVGRWTNSA